MTTQPLTVSLIIPVYNEAATVGAVLAEALELPPHPAYSVEIIVVDGGSRDATVTIAQSAGARVVPQRGRGYGAACYTGLEESQADILVFLDGDYSDPPAAIPALLDVLLNQPADIVLGVRKRERGALPVQAVFGNWLVARLIKLLYRHSYSDLPSFKAIRRRQLINFDMQERRYGWTVEMLVKAVRAGCVIAEVPIQYRKRGGGKSKVSGTFSGTIKAAYQLLQTAWKYRHWQPVS